MQQPQQPSRPSAPADAFPDGRFDLWREHVLTLDADVVLAAAIAEKLNTVLAARRASTGETMRGLAVALGVPRGILMTTSRCLAYPQTTTIRRLQDALGASLDPTVDILLVKVAAQQKLQDPDVARMHRDLAGRAREIERLRTELATTQSRVRALEQQLAGAP